MIKILFDNEKYIPTQFRAKYGTLTYRNLNIKNLLKFSLDHLIIINELGIKFKCLDKKERCNNYILELLNNGGRNIHLIRFNIEKQALLDLIIKVVIEAFRIWIFGDLSFLILVTFNNLLHSEM
ncbi:unnamed protein product [Meloidogyne enterolobii]|uniref:Uncharacterized protein n=2 Tax=Meloidogyne enterolobii TaxID=390850 RepID=A0A6V7X741_MELEN|nr:unnamed protein product [Meloidogyne enterolobii]